MCGETAMPRIFKPREATFLGRNRQVQERKLGDRRLSQHPEYPVRQRKAFGNNEIDSVCSGFMSKQCAVGVDPAAHLRIRSGLEAPDI
jgi:hypothetical protein